MLGKVTLKLFASDGGGKERGRKWGERGGGGM